MKVLRTFILCNLKLHEGLADLHLSPLTVNRQVREGLKVCLLQIEKSCDGLKITVGETKFVGGLEVP